MSTDQDHTAVRSDSASSGPPIALAAAGVLIAVGGLLHPKGEPLAQLTDPTWPIAHILLLAGMATAAASLLALARTRAAHWPSRVRVATLVAAGAAGLGVVEMIPHWLAGTEADAVAHGGAHPLYDLHLQIGLFSNFLFGTALAVLAVLAARSRALGGGAALAVLAVVGGLAFGLAAPLLVVTGNPLFAILFIGSVVVGLWLLVSGALLARRRTATAVSVRTAP